MEYMYPYIKDKKSWQLKPDVMYDAEWPMRASAAVSVQQAVGLDITLGYPRFTFGSTELLNGVDFIPAMIGLFGISAILRYSLTPRAG